MEETRRMSKWFTMSDFHKEFLKSRKQKLEGELLKAERGREKAEGERGPLTTDH